MGQRLNLCSKLKPIGVGAAKASLNRANELHGLDPKPGDLAMGRLKVSNTHWRTEPTNVEKVGDDLWLGVKGQSNSEIAGSPRNLFR
jgi:hypothetical protein